MFIKNGKTETMLENRQKVDFHRIISNWSIILDRGGIKHFYRSVIVIGATQLFCIRIFSAVAAYLLIQNKYVGIFVSYCSFLTSCVFFCIHIYAYIYAHTQVVSPQPETRDLRCRVKNLSQAPA
jgi:hypothetical protein